MNESLTIMHQQAMAMLDKAYSPYSKFAVGVCIRSDNGELFTGCNIENASFSLTMCAEAVALAKMVSSGQQNLTDIIVVCSSDYTVPPCGSCRQRLIEFADKSAMVHFADHTGVVSSKSLWHLLPEAFSPRHFA